MANLTPKYAVDQVMIGIREYENHRVGHSTYSFHRGMIGRVEIRKNTKDGIFYYLDGIDEPFREDRLVANEYDIGRFIRPLIIKGTKKEKE